MRSSRLRIEKNLTQVGQELTRLREELRILAEQRAQVDDEAEDARLRSLVSETPLAGKEYRESSKTAVAFRKDEAVKLARVQQLEQRQDELLEKLFSTK